MSSHFHNAGRTSIIGCALFTTEKVLGQNLQSASFSKSARTFAERALTWSMCVAETGVTRSCLESNCDSHHTSNSVTMAIVLALTLTVRRSSSAESSSNF